MYFLGFGRHYIFSFILGSTAETEARVPITHKGQRSGSESKNSLW